MPRPSFPTRRRRLVVHAAFLLAGALLLTGLSPAQQPAGKRPLKHTDYDSWRAIQAPTLSRDGKYLAYNLMPGDGDGEFVVRNVATGAEHRLPRGRAVAAAPTEGEPGGAPTPTPSAGPAAGRGGRPGAGGAGAGAALAGIHQFTPDVKAIVFPLLPTKAEVDKAKAEKKKPEEMPHTVLAIMDLGTGKITARIEGATSFSVGGTGAGLLVYRRQAKPEEKAAKPEEKPAKPEEKPTKPAAPAGSPTPPKTYGTPLVLRNLADASERVLDDVLDFSLTKDGKTLVFTVASRKEEANGVYVLALPSGSPAPVLAGKGRYTRLTWDEKQTQFVFSSDKEDVASAAPKFKVYHWSRAEAARPIAEKTPQLPPMGGTVLTTAATLAVQSAPATATASATDLLGPTPPGLRSGWVIRDSGGFSFSPDGTRLYLSTGPAPAPEKPAVAAKPAAAPTGFPRRGGGGANAAPPADDNKVALDLWHWKDDFIQPMQKVRSAGEQNRTYRAVYFLKDKLFRQLSDETLDVNPALESDWATGVDDRKYRHMTDYLGGEIPRDYALVNTRTGERRPLMNASHWGVSFSPRGRYLLSFDGKDWQAISVPDGKKTNLTGTLAVKFANEEWDTPSDAPPYGVAGWTADEKHVLLNDHYDVWKVALDGSGAKALTAGRAARTVFRLVPLPQGDGEERERGLDLVKPLLFKADNERTRDDGFFRLDPGAAEPRMLVMGARRYGLPVKAKDADTLLLTASTFSEAPDYYVTGPDFHELRRVTDANPQKKDFVWGKSELVRYKNLDGVELSGVLIKPENFDPAKKYPLIVYIYERLSQSLHNFTPPTAGTSINPTFYASNGYLVLMPDIVYTVGSPGQSALKCVLPAIQAVVDKGCVDEKAIGIQGHSWGGYQIAYLVTQTTRFKAAVAGAPVSNMVSAYDGIRWGTGMPRQFQYERTQSRIGGTLWQYPSRFVENSPIFMADRVRTPLMMLHNDQDDAVPWYQGVEYFLALRRLGKECYLFNYNGEFHGLRRKANQRDWTMRMQQFFDHHLKGAAKPEWMDKGVPYLERDKEKERWKEVLGAAKG